MPRILIILTFLFLTLTACSTSQTKENYSKINETTLGNGLVVHEYRLANGMKLLLVPDDSAPVFTYQVWFPVGAAAEKMDKRLNYTGLAHLFEHMMFRGTQKHPDGAFDQQLTLAGGVGMNATTWIDRTNYYQSLPRESLELVFELEADRMVNLALDEKLFNTERGAVFGELKMGDDNPSRFMSKLLWRTAFRVHPYRYSTIGTKEELERMTLADAQYFYKTYYAPNNATLILIGDIDVNESLKLAHKYYGSIPFQTVPRPQAPIEPPQRELRRVVETHQQARNQMVRIGFHAPAINHEDIPTLEVIASILATGEGSTFKKVLVDSGLTSDASAWVYTVKYPSLFVVNTNIKRGVSRSAVESKIFTELEKLKQGKVTQLQLERAINQMLLSEYNTISSNRGLANMMGEALMSSDDYMKYFDILARAKKVSVEDISRVAKKYFKRSNATVAVLVPPKGR